MWNLLQYWAQNFRSSSVPLHHTRSLRQHQEIFDILNLEVLSNSHRYVCHASSLQILTQFDHWKRFPFVAYSYK